METNQKKMVTNYSIIILGTQMTHQLLPGLFQFLSLIFNQMRQPSKCIVKILEVTQFDKHNFLEFA